MRDLKVRHRGIYKEVSLTWGHKSHFLSEDFVSYDQALCESSISHRGDVINVRWKSIIHESLVSGWAVGAWGTPCSKGGEGRGGFRCF